MLYPHMAAAGPEGQLPLLKDGQFMLPAVKIFSYLSESYPDLDLDGKVPGGKRADVSAHVERRRAAVSLRAGLTDGLVRTGCGARWKPSLRLWTRS